MSCLLSLLLFFFFKDPAPTEIYTLSLHDALPICLFFLRVGRMARQPVSEVFVARTDPGFRRRTKGFLSASTEHRHGIQRGFSSRKQCRGRCGAGKAVTEWELRGEQGRSAGSSRFTEKQSGRGCVSSAWESEWAPKARGENGCN